jgi:hypothetical protein
MRAVFCLSPSSSCIEVALLSLLFWERSREKSRGRIEQEACLLGLGKDWNLDGGKRGRMPHCFMLAEKCR